MTTRRVMDMEPLSPARGFRLLFVLAEKLPKRLKKAIVLLALWINANPYFDYAKTNLDSDGFSRFRKRDAK